MLQMINKFSKREKTILTVSVLFVLVAFLDRAILNPIADKMQSFEEEIKTTEYEMTKNSKILNQRQRIEKEEKKYASFVKTAASEEEETALLLRAVESLASRTNVYLVDIKPAGAEESGDIKKFLINISCEAQMKPLLSFMHAIENSDILMHISAFNMAPKSRDSDINRCELMLNKIVVK